MVVALFAESAAAARTVSDPASALVYIRTASDHRQGQSRSERLRLVSGLADCRSRGTECVTLHIALSVTGSESVCVSMYPCVCECV